MHDGIDFSIDVSISNNIFVEYLNQKFLLFWCIFGKNYIRSCNYKPIFGLKMHILYGIYSNNKCIPIFGYPDFSFYGESLFIILK